MIRWLWLGSRNFYLSYTFHQNWGGILRWGQLTQCYSQYSVRSVFNCYNLYLSWVSFVGKFLWLTPQTPSDWTGISSTSQSYSHKIQPVKYLSRSLLLNEGSLSEDQQAVVEGLVYSLFTGLPVSGGEYSKPLNVNHILNYSVIWIFLPQTRAQAGLGLKNADKYPLTRPSVCSYPALSWRLFPSVFRPSRTSCLLLPIVCWICVKNWYECLLRESSRTG